ncbi:MAG TPA: HD domain-containing protein [Anaerolineales bacterium]|nr:HD domain-containing protein [Anaerolineales bacterium]
MVDKYADLWEQVKPYLDTRQNDVHTRIAYGFAERLLALYPEADEAVILPAVILHDTGWKMIPEDQQVKAFGPNMKDADLRRVHEVEGVRIAREILTAVEYDPARRDEILTIIDGHDSRETALSLNDQLMKDADKLWRFTQTGIGIDHQRFGIQLREYATWLGQQIERWMFTPEAVKLAHETFDESQAVLLGGGKLE